MKMKTQIFLTLSILSVIAIAASGAETVAPSPSALIQSLGVNIHLSSAGPYYGAPGAIYTALTYLGISTVRDLAPNTNPDPNVVSTSNTLASEGIKFDALIPGGTPVSLTSDLAAITSFAKSYPSALAAIEGPNEINYEPITYGNQTNTILAGASVTKALWSAVQASKTLKSVPVFALTLGGGDSNDPADEKELSNLSSYVTNGNVHIYGSASDNAWTADAPYWVPILTTDTPSKSTIMTETGYFTAPGNVDELSAAKYNLNVIFDNASRGFVGTYFYELVDEASDPDYLNPEMHYGQFHNDWTPKVGATAIQNLTTVLGYMGSGTGSTLKYKVSGLPSNGGSYFLASSNGSAVVTWIDATVYNPTTNTDIVAPNYSVKVNFGSTFGYVFVFDPMVGNQPIASYTGVSTVTITVSDHPLIVEGYN
jgi:trimeric autotransporter adhesin